MTDDPVSPLCSRNARLEKGERGAAIPSFLLAEAARSECAPSMRAVKDSLATPLRQIREILKALARVMARHGKSIAKQSEGRAGEKWVGGRKRCAQWGLIRAILETT